MLLERLFRAHVVDGITFGELIAYLVLSSANGAIFFHFWQNPLGTATSFLIHPYSYSTGLSATNFLMSKFHVIVLVNFILF